MNIATNVRCPSCQRKLCKIREYNECPYVEIKHKGAFVLATKAIVGCLDCKKTYVVCSDGTEIEEIELQ